MARTWGGRGGSARPARIAAASRAPSLLAPTLEAPPEGRKGLLSGTAAPGPPPFPSDTSRDWSLGVASQLPRAATVTSRPQAGPLGARAAGGRALLPRGCPGRARAPPAVRARARAPSGPAATGAASCPAGRRPGREPGPPMTKRAGAGESATAATQRARAGRDERGHFRLEGGKSITLGPQAHRFPLGDFAGFYQFRLFPRRSPKLYHLFNLFSRLAFNIISFN
ncbi:atherin-like [Camelus ferus]|uniref:Atherin-like n=1 Tax=Camelus ferus TaxID=419612 RepID=A0A8B8TVR7_CAMFR|nr:atherin-like [Camelus ferus]